MRRCEPGKRGHGAAPISTRCPPPSRSGSRREDWKARVRLAFEEPPPAGAEMVTRSHPLPATLAETLLEGALDPGCQSGAVARPRRRLADAGGQDSDHGRSAAAAVQAHHPRPARAAAPGRGGAARSPGTLARHAWLPKGEAARALLEVRRQRRSRVRSRGSACSPKRDQAHRRRARRLDRRLCARARASSGRGSRPGARCRRRAVRASASSRCCRPTSSVSSFCVPAGTEAWRAHAPSISARLRCHHGRRRADCAGDAGAHRPARGRSKARRTTPSPRA